jgi:hypothetical protein
MQSLALAIENKHRAEILNKVFPACATVSHLPGIARIVFDCQTANESGQYVIGDFCTRLRCWRLLFRFLNAE